ncbi:DUF192 domain-containing protein [Actibacterium sp.]|uniref:DUF192 domain-containing protein n=1 Tax=Actibacterium sp. TaxID=1872125 RepID=UPI003564E157
MGKRGFRTGLVGLILSILAAGPGLAMCDEDQVALKGDWGEARFRVEIADDSEERALGLMYRPSMPAGQGMLFVYPAPQRAVFWMKNTLIPLDMIFVDATGQVSRVHSNAVPQDLTPIDGGEGVLAVLEINGGLAAQIGIAPGTVLRHPAFGGDAIWPCTAP